MRTLHRIANWLLVLGGLAIIAALLYTGLALLMDWPLPWRKMLGATIHLSIGSTALTLLAHATDNTAPHV